jgi:hypothetical protein
MSGILDIDSKSQLNVYVADLMYKLFLKICRAKFSVHFEDLSIETQDRVARYILGDFIDFCRDNVEQYADSDDKKSQIRKRLDMLLAGKGNEKLLKTFSELENAITGLTANYALNHHKEF